MKSPRKFDSEISINPKGEWIFRGNTIDQKDILLYFRQSLRESLEPKGVFIDNHFGELSENGYLQIDGFPLHILHVNILEDQGMAVFLGDDQSEIPISDLQLYHNENEEIFCMRKDHSMIKYQFSRSALGNLLPYLELNPDSESGKERNVLKLGNTEYPIQLWTGSISIPIPQFG